MSVENKIKEVDRLTSELERFNNWVDRDAKICFIASELKLVKRGYWGGTCEAKIHGTTEEFNDKIFKEISSYEFLKTRIESYREELSERITKAKQEVLDSLQ